MLLRYGPSLRGICRCIVDGVFDSLRLPSTLIFFLSSVTVRVRTAQCIVLNGVIFLGSILLADFIMAPMLRALLALGGITSSNATVLGGLAMPIASASIPLPSGVEEAHVGAWLNVVFLYAYQLLWIYPLYAISFILNAIWYQVRPSKHAVRLSQNLRGHECFHESPCSLLRCCVVRHCARRTSPITRSSHMVVPLKRSRSRFRSGWRR
jgi:hypothetical protein